jgi:hypothetical protein
MLEEWSVTVAIEIALPYRSDWREMSNILDYCKGKGADRSSLEARFGGGESLRETLNALEQLSLIERSESGDTRLTSQGEALAYAPDQTRLRERLIEAMLAYSPYRFPLERARANGAAVLDGPWIEHIWQVDMRLGQPRNRVEEARTFFYRLADEAGLGTYRRGVRGQTTRLELARDFADRLGAVVEQVSGVSSATAGRIASPQDSVAPDLELPAGMPTATAAGSLPETYQAARTGSNVVGIGAAQASAGQVPSLPGLPQGISVQVDMSDWDLERIEAFLRLIGYLPLNSPDSLNG